MGQYRKKPVVIEARQFTVDWAGDWREPWHSLAEWCGGTAHRPAEMDDDGWCSGDPVIDIKTLEGTMRADVGDWIIQGVQGEFYPCKPDIFEATYEAVEP